jgi:aryl-alcohol dehydrogenase-like predicted oxidoreductase
MNAARHESLAGATSVELGLGLIGIGRPWPRPDAALPSAETVHELLTTALDLGVRLVDTAPAYGASEKLLGEFLRAHDPGPDALVVSTKAGEVWTAEQGSVVDHSVESLQASFDSSRRLLGRVDLLQLHKCSPDVLADAPVLHWLEERRSRGDVDSIGASVSSVDALDLALSLGLFDYVQIPFHRQNTELGARLTALSDPPIGLFNRPFDSGSLNPGSDPFAAHSEFLDRGVVLTGTTNPRHLSDNVAAFSRTFS